MPAGNKKSGNEHTSGEVGTGKVGDHVKVNRPGRSGDDARAREKARVKMADMATAARQNAAARAEMEKAQQMQENRIARAVEVCATFYNEMSTPPISQHLKCNCLYGNTCHGGVFHHDKFDFTRQPRCSKKHGICPENSDGFQCTRKVCLCIHPTEVGGFQQHLMPIRIVEWCRDTCTDPDCPKKHPDHRNVCMHDKWDPESDTDPEPHQLCPHHSSAMGCGFFHWCRNQMVDGVCNEPNCRMDHWDVKCVPAPAMGQFPPMAAA
jgi:hypothetical protein